MKFITRDQWGAGETATPQSHPIGSTFGITAHWAGNGLGSITHAKCFDKVKQIEAGHVAKGWAGIAYNALTCPHGYVFEGRGLHTQSAANGNSDDNDDWYAVCYLGGVGDDFTLLGKQAFLDAFGWLRDKGNAGPERNGHRDHKATQCPGDEIYNWVRSLPADAGTEEGKDWFDMATRADLRAEIEAAIWKKRIPVSPGSKAEAHYGKGTKLSLPNAMYWLGVESESGTDEVLAAIEELEVQ